MCLLKKKHCIYGAKNLYLGSGRIIKIHDELHSVVLFNSEDFNLKPEQYQHKLFTCLKSYDNVAIFIPQEVYEEKGYAIFGDCSIRDPEDGKYLINITKFIDEYKYYSNTLCKSSQTVVPTYIDICKAFVCLKDNTIICIETTDHIDKTDEIYHDLSQLRQIKERLHL